MENCIFCKIVEDEIPCLRVYEDSDVLVILDINPISKGHMLVLPKKHYDNIYDIPDKLISKIYSVVKKMSELLRDKFAPLGIVIEQNNGERAGQTISHFHVHIKPIYPDTRLLLDDGHLRIQMTDEEMQQVRDILWSK